MAGGKKAKLLFAELIAQNPDEKMCVQRRYPSGSVNRLIHS